MESVHDSMGKKMHTNTVDCWRAIFGGSAGVPVPPSTKEKLVTRLLGYGIAHILAYLPPCFGHCAIVEDLQ